MEPIPAGMDPVASSQPVIESATWHVIVLQPNGAAAEEPNRGRPFHILKLSLEWVAVWSDSADLLVEALVD